MPRSLWLIPRILLAGFMIYGFLWVKSFPRTWDDAPAKQNPKPETGKKGDHDHQQGHKAKPKPPPADPEKVIVSIKTGATEAFDKLPSQLLLTDSKYLSNLLLFSDLEQDIGSFHLHDVLSDIPETHIANNTDFDLYRQQYEYWDLGLDVGALKSVPDPNPDWRTKGHNAAWALDKYKNLHMLQRAWDYRPSRHWYLFIDTDTYVSRRNLYEWLGQHDHTKPWYFGVPTQNPHFKDGDTYPFAHGGSGFILSGEALKRFAVDKAGIPGRWDKRIAKMWFGDYVTAAALHEELGLNITSSFPEFSGMKPSTIPYSAELWCGPVVALHHVRPEESCAMWQFEREREGKHSPMTFEELWKKFVKSEDLGAPREDWDNLSSDFSNVKWNIVFKKKDEKPKAKRSEAEEAGKEEPASDPDESFEACEKACAMHENCMQYSFSNSTAPNFNGNGETKCHLSSSFRVGSMREPDEIVSKKKPTIWRSWKSGWRRDRFELWAAQQKCGE
ncbi:hypothetical protein BU16DRAFT_522024 [Lophium mytilinum]|uniref:N-acetylgalactosaminide beta-1,3-galactosyltransferase n=1 Tax=Lophium mytilinum TaxID=390894 RepID=A0A6A6R961_9PEZI|nr:hypothetical protein BU16DRAFT_522024 [Lophium mytilinum]